MTHKLNVKKLFCRNTLTLTSVQQRILNATDQRKPAEPSAVEMASDETGQRSSAEEGVSKSIGQQISD